MALRVLRRLLAACMGLVLAALPAPVRAAGPPLTVFAASSLTDVMPALAARFTARTGQAVRVNLASSALLVQQIEAGARADLLVTADTDWMDYAAAHGLIDSHGRRTVATNRLVLIAPAGSSLQVRLAPGVDLAAPLGSSARLAIADPASVPAGRYARQALSALGAWPGVARRLAPADNVRAALRYVATGNAPLGIVYRTDALADPSVRIVAQFDSRLHEPILYPAALCRGASPAANALLTFLTTPAARAVMRRAGFRPAPAAHP